MPETNLPYLIEKNLINLCVAVAASPGGRLVETPNYACTDGSPSAWHNKVFGFERARHAREAVLRQLREDIQAGRAPDNLLVGVFARSFLTEAGLLARGFVPYFEQTGMAIETAAWRDEDRGRDGDFPPPADRAELTQWVAVLDEAFSGERSVDLYQNLMARPGISFFAGRADGRIVSTAVLSIKDNIAGIHLVGTSTDFRGRGLATGATRAPLRRAREQGLPLAVLQASPMGRNIYARLGFAAHSQIQHWELGK
jgi:RimJ/RimL family protein N-acetyltransferase